MNGFQLMRLHRSHLLHCSECEKKVRLLEVDRVLVPVEPDYEYLLDWAVDVGGNNYRPDMQEIIEVMDTVLGIGETP